MNKASAKVTLAMVDLTTLSLYEDFELKLRQTPVAQIESSLRGDNVRAFGRGNVRNTLVFSRVEVFSTLDAAIHDVLEFGELWPTLAGACNVSTATNVQGYDIADAAIVDVSAEITNFITRHTITIVGGAISIVAP